MTSTSTTVITAVISLIGSLIESITDSDSVDNVITILEAWVPTIVSTIPTLVSDVNAIIDTLKGNDTLTDDQIAAIDALNVSADAAYDAAIKQGDLE